MADVFLSYARADIERARAIRDGLIACGLDVFYDADIIGGEAWPERLEIELDQAKCVIVCLSEQSMRSSGVREETARALKARSRKALPVLLEPGLVDRLPFGLERIQCVSLINWDGKLAHDDWTKLEESVWAFVVPKWYRDRARDSENRLKSELASLQATLESTRKSLEYTERERAEAERKNDQLAHDIKGLQDGKGVSENTVAALAKEIVERKLEMETSIAANAGLKATLDAAQKSLAETENRIGQLQAEYDKQLRALQEENASVRSQRDELHGQNAHNLAQLDEHTRRLKELLEKNNELTVTDGQARNLLGRAIRDGERLEGENQDLRSRRESLEKEVEVLRNANAELSSENKVLKHGSGLREGEFEQQRQANEQLKQENEQFKKELNDLGATAQKLEQANSQLKKDNEQLRQGRDPLDQVVDQLRKSNDQLKEENTKLAVQHRKLAADGEGYRKASGQLGAQNEQLKRASGELGAEVDRLKGRVGAFKRRMLAAAIAALILVPGGFASGVLWAPHPAISNQEVVTDLRGQLDRARADNARLQNSLSNQDTRVKSAEAAAAASKQKAKESDNAAAALRQRAEKADEAAAALRLRAEKADEAAAAFKQKAKEAEDAAIALKQRAEKAEADLKATRVETGGIARYYVGVASFESIDKAEETLAQVRTKLRDDMDGLKAELKLVMIESAPMYRLMVGRFGDRETALEFCEGTVKPGGWKRCWVFDENELAFRTPVKP